ncbi:hypothetical protein QVD17_23822 [Tagetes erecta]|uniref:Uncharacterized protein n=1 Tax=Tagetes erecta TaxID=13708 RepID=A0AAD8KEU9_TARER|nr:hypothetical protein QVD17_23822 [Tagetes erecta]
MGACCSKTDNSIPSPQIQIKHPENNNTTIIPIVASPTQQQQQQQQQSLEKDVFVVKNWNNHETDTHPDQETRKSVERKKNVIDSAGDDESGKMVLRTSSCTEQEVDAILIQCGRLSRSNSGVKPAGGETPTRGRRYSGSKRSFDFDMEMSSKNNDNDDSGQQQRQIRVSSPSRRRSRERSGSKERGTGTGGRRVSRSPNRRSESPNPNCNTTVAAGAGSGSSRPGKMVSVPATDKSNNAGVGEAVTGVGGGGVKRIQAKRTAGETIRTAASPRKPVAQRNPLGEIDTNVIGSEQHSKKPNGENLKHNQIGSRTRSAWLSGDLDINPETLINPNPSPVSYASVLLEDIQNFHHKNPVISVKKEGGVFVESEKVVNADVTEPSLHKYVTVRRGGDADAEEQESSGSNSFAGMSSSWEPNSGDSTDCWTSKSRSDAGGMGVERSDEYLRNGIGRGKDGVRCKSVCSLPNNGVH